MEAPFTIGAFRVDPARNAALAGDQETSLEPRVMDVLCQLAATPGEVVARDELIDRVWGVEHGADESLTRAISLIRKMFRTAGDGLDYIETIPKRGYRLTQPVAPAPPLGAAAAAPPAHSPDTLQPASTAPEAAVPADSSQPPDPRRADAAPATAGRWVKPLAAASAVGVLLFLGVSLWLRGGEAEQQPAVEPSLAVLPFEALTSAPEDQIFADGLSVQLLTTLAKIVDLDVATQRATFAAGREDAAPAAIGAALDVAYLLNGSVQRSADRLRISARLLRVADGVHVWAETYDRSWGDVFQIQDDIVRKVARQLEIELGIGRYRDRPAGAGVDPRALEQYYLGLGYYGDRFREDDARQRAYAAFRNAAAIDPEFAAAWSGMALVGSTSLGGPLGRDRATLVAEVDEAFERAMALEADNPETLAALTAWHLSARLDLDRARQFSIRALSLNEELPAAAYVRARYLEIVGQVEEARRIHDRMVARELDSPVRALVRARFLAEIGETADAFAFFDACQARRCLREGFVAFGAGYAALSGDPVLRAAWRRHWEEFEAELAGLPPAAKPRITEILPGFFSIVFDRADRAVRVAELRTLYATDPVTQSVGLWGPVFAEILPPDDFFDALELAADRGDLLGNEHALMPYFGTNPYPAWVLEHPRYIALFERPQLKRFAELRRANGWTQGLPVLAD
ncbi:MAG: winged helix-turn-helix domain-containing protein [Pseudomonadota bacterium]